MISYDFDKMLYTIPADKHSTEEIREILGKHPEIKFVSLVGIDVGGHDTDEKIPVEEFLKDMDISLFSGFILNIRPEESLQSANVPFLQVIL